MTAMIISGGLIPLTEPAHPEQVTANPIGPAGKLIAKVLTDMQLSASTIVVFVESGEAFDTLKQLVHQVCQDQCLMLPVLPLEYESVHYLLHQSASEGDLANYAVYRSEHLHVLSK